MDENLLEHVLDYFIHQQGHLLMELQSNRTNQVLRQKILAIAKEQFQLHGAKKQDILLYTEKFEHFFWGYYILDDLIADPAVSDIKCYAHDRIRVKSNGKRETARVSFRDEEDYRRFIGMVATKNEVNLSTINAIQKFTDYTSSEDYILRFNICSGWLNTSGLPFLHIRKTPKKKKNLEELVRIGFMTEKQKEYLKEKARTASGIFITGKGAAGKTTLMNAMLEEIPEDKSGLVIQESDELFLEHSEEHPDMLFQHIRESKGEGRVRYGMKEMATNGLLIDLDYFIIGEIKGDEAAQFSIAADTGHICWATGHGGSAKEGIEKLADYIQRATGDSYNKCLKVISDLEVVVFLKDYQICEIAEIKGLKGEDLLLVPVGGEEKGERSS